MKEMTIDSNESTKDTKEYDEDNYFNSYSYFGIHEEMLKVIFI